MKRFWFKGFEEGRRRRPGRYLQHNPEKTKHLMFSICSELNFTSHYVLLFTLKSYLRPTVLRAPECTRFSECYAVRINGAISLILKGVHIFVKPRHHRVRVANNSYLITIGLVSLPSFYYRETLTSSRD